MKFEMVKLVAGENGDNERMVLYTKQDFVETFGFQYELCIDTPEQKSIILSYPEDLRDVLTEVFHNTTVEAFWTAPLMCFNQKMLEYYLTEYSNEEGSKMIWLMSSYES